LFRDIHWRSARESAVTGDDFSRTNSFASDQASSVDSYCLEGNESRESRLLRQYLHSCSQGEDDSKRARFLKEVPLVESFSSSDSMSTTSYEPLPILDEIDEFVFSFPKSIISRVLSSTSFSQSVESTASSSVGHDEEDGCSVMSVSHSEDSHTSGQGVERTISSGSVMSVRYSEDFHTVGQGIERTISDSMDYQGYVESTCESDQVNDGHASLTIVSGADGHEVVYSEDHISFLLPQEATKELNLADQLLCIINSPINFLSSKIKSAIPVTKASPPTGIPDVGSKPLEASLALNLTADSSIGRRVGSCHDEEYGGLVVTLVNSHASIVGQEVECTLIGHLDSSDAPDHENDGHAVHSMVSDASGQEVAYTKDCVSSLLSTDNAEKANLHVDKHPAPTKVVTRKPTPMAKMASAYHAMKAPAPPASLGTRLTASSFLPSRVGRHHDEENYGSVIPLVDSRIRGQGLHTIKKDSTPPSFTPDAGLNFSEVSLAQRDSGSGYIFSEPSLTPKYSEGVECEGPIDRNANAADLRDSVLVVEPSALPITPIKLGSGDFSRKSLKWRAGRPVASNEASEKETASSSRPKSPRRLQQSCHDNKYRAVSSSCEDQISAVAVLDSPSKAIPSTPASGPNSSGETLQSSPKAEVSYSQQFKLTSSKPDTRDETSVAAEAETTPSPRREQASSEEKSPALLVSKTSTLAMSGLNNRGKEVDKAAQSTKQRPEMSVPCKESSTREQAPMARPKSPPRLEKSSPVVKVAKLQSSRTVSSSHKGQTMTVVASDSPSKAMVGPKATDTKPAVALDTATSPKASLQSAPEAERSPRQLFNLSLNMSEPKKQTRESNGRDEDAFDEEAETVPSPSVEKSLPLTHVLKRSKLASKVAQNANERGKEVITATPHKIRIPPGPLSKPTECTSEPCKETSKKGKPQISRTKSPQRLQQPSPKMKSIKPKSSRAVSSSRKDQISMGNAWDSPLQVKTVPSFTGTTLSAMRTVSKTSHSLVSKHGTSKSSLLKKLLSAAYGESLCHCDLESNNDTEESEPNDVDQIECILHGDECRDPMGVQIEIHTAPSCAATIPAVMTMKVQSQGKTRSLPTLKGLSKRLPRLYPESRSHRGRHKSNQLSEQREGRNGTEEPRVERGGSKGSVELDEMVSIIAVESGSKDQLQIPSKILQVRPHPESRSLRCRSKLNKMPKQNQTPEKKEARNGTDEPRVGDGGCKLFVESDGVDSISAVKNGNRSQSLTPSKILRPHPESRFLRGRRKRSQMPEQNQTPVKTEASKETDEPRELMVCESGDFF
jgi:hypothetical protein